MTITINLLEQRWVACLSVPSALRGMLHNVLSEAGWRDGIEVTRTIIAPNIIIYTFDKL